MDHSFSLLEITHANIAKKGRGGLVFANIMLDLYANVHIIM